MARFNLNLPDKEFEILEKVAEATERTKTDIMREFIRSMKGKENIIESFNVACQHHPPESPRKLTRADVARVMSCMNDAGWFNGYVDEEQTVDELIASYPDLVEQSNEI